MSGLERVQKRDYYLVHAGREKSSRAYLILGQDAKGFTGLYFDPDSDARTETHIPFAELDRFHLSFDQYFKEFQIRYTSALEFLVLRAIGFAQFQAVADKVSQFLFNVRPLSRTDRMRVLQYFFEETLKDRRFHVSYVAIVQGLNGIRAFGHPHIEDTQRYYELVLNSLVDSGDLERREIYYNLSPHALVTLSGFEVEERRHKAEITQQRILGFLTFVLILIGLLQAYVTFIANAPKP